MAAAPSLPFNLTNGVVADATQVMSNLNTLVTWITNNASQIDASTVFTAIPSGPATNPTTANQFTRKAYVDAFFPVTSANLGAGAVIAGKITAGTIVNADISASAAIAWSKIATTGAIVNADVSAAAAIAYSKLSLAGSVANSDLNAGTGQPAGPWNNGNGAISFSNATGPTYEYYYKQMGKTVYAKFRFTGGTATATGPMQIGFNFTFPAVGQTCMGLGFNAACRVDFIASTNTINLYKDATTLNWTTGNALANAGFSAVLEVA